MDDQEPQTGLLVDLTEPEAPRPKAFSPPNLEEQLRNMELSIKKRRASAQPKRPKPESPPNFDDVPNIHDEVFDFDLPSLSTSSDSLDKVNTEDDDDEIFFGPVGYMEKCVSKVVEQEASPKKEEVEQAALSAAELVQVFVEAQKVACFISTQGGEKQPSTPSLGFLPYSSLNDDVMQEAPRSQGRKRKGTFTLDDGEELEEGTPTKRKGLERKGTFRVSKRKSTFTLSDPEDADEPAPSKPGHERKGTFTMDDLDTDKTNNKKEAPAKPVIETTGKGVQRLSLPQAGKSLLQRNSLQRRSLRAPSGRASVGSGIGVKGPLKATSRGSSSSSSTSTSPKEETKEPPKRLSGSLPKPSSVTSFLPRPGSNSGLKAPSASGLKAPTRKSLNPPAPVKAAPLTSTATSTAPAPAPAPAPTQSTTTKPSLKGPMTKMQLLRPGQLQMRGSGLKAPTAVKGPLKATERLTGLKGPQLGRQPLASHVNGVPEQNMQRKRPASPIRQSLEGTTPVKQDKNVQPKRLMTGFQNLSTPPRKSSESSNASTPSSTKRRSFLPTPGKTFTGPRRSSSSVSSIGSQDSMASPVLQRGRSPATRRSLASPHARSLNSPMRTRPKMQHTPLNKENESREPKRSIWSPIRRPKPLTKEEELTTCTKRTAVQY